MAIDANPKRESIDQNEHSSLEGYTENEKNTIKI